jgi:hypothetical protein
MPQITIRVSDEALGRIARAAIEYNLPILKVAGMILDRTRNFEQLLQPTPNVKKSHKTPKRGATRPSEAYIVTMGPDA